MREELKRLGMLSVAAVVLAVMPPGETPHLVQKLDLLRQGYLHKPMDIFDLLMHGGLIVITSGYGLFLLYKFLKERQT